MAKPWSIISSILELKCRIDKSWTLFLDRDGVINEKRENDYVKNWSEFSFIDGSLGAISQFSNVFGKIIIVTNQRGVGRGLMEEEDLISIHHNMVEEIELNSGRIDKIYYCTEVLNAAYCRKPNVGMGYKAKNDFPDIDFTKSVLIGDSISDIKFGKSLNMMTILIQNELNENNEISADFNFTNLIDASNFINKSYLKCF